MLICIDYESETPIYLQIRNQIVMGIADGELSEGEKLPTIRSLANDLGVNMMTVSKAYQLLKAESFIYGDRRNGVTVKKPPESPKSLSTQSLENLKLVATDAKLAGLSLEDFILTCKSIYEKEDAQ
ncbi:MAG: GntR family transcriptional regulator [Ruminococcaceae bacterium]|nr:GntR family transcriptional regulator [Oscillospiraceae bacterium]